MFLRFFKFALPKTNIFAPENQWLEDQFPFGMAQPPRCERLHSLKLTAKAPTNGWLEYKPFLLGFGLFSGVFAVSFREGSFRECNIQEFPREKRVTHSMHPIRCFERSSFLP